MKCEVNGLGSRVLRLLDFMFVLFVWIIVMVE